MHMSHIYSTGHLLHTLYIDTRDVVRTIGVALPFERPA